MQTIWLGTIHNYALEYKFFYSSTHYIHRTSYGHPYDVQWISIWIFIWISSGCPLDILWMWIWIGRGLDVWISYGYPMDVRRRLGITKAVDQGLMSLPRPYFSSPDSSYQLHVLGYASNRAYGAVDYLVSNNQVAFVMSK